MHNHPYSDRMPLLPHRGQDPDSPDSPEEPEEPEERTRAPRLGKIALDILKKDRTILISEEVSPRLTERVFTQLLWLDSHSQDPIRLFINTPGGSADDGFAIFDAIRFIRSPVVNISMGLNASAGTSSSWGRRGSAGWPSPMPAS